MDVNYYLVRAVFFVKPKQYSVFVAVAVDEEDTLKYSNYVYVLVLDVYELI